MSGSTANIGADAYNGGGGSGSGIGLVPRTQAYFFNAIDGNDANDGLTEATPVKTAAALKAIVNPTVGAIPCVVHVLGYGGLFWDEAGLEFNRQVEFITEYDSSTVLLFNLEFKTPMRFTGGSVLFDHIISTASLVVKAYSLEIKNGTSFSAGAYEIAVQRFTCDTATSALETCRTFGCNFDLVANDVRMAASGAGETSWSANDCRFAIRTIKFNYEANGFAMLGTVEFSLNSDILEEDGVIQCSGGNKISLSVRDTDTTPGYDGTLFALLAGSDTYLSGTISATKRCWEKVHPTAVLQDYITYTSDRDYSFARAFPLTTTVSGELEILSIPLDQLTGDDIAIEFDLLLDTGTSNTLLAYRATDNGSISGTASLRVISKYAPAPLLLPYEIQVAWRDDGLNRKWMLIGLLDADYPLTTVVVMNGKVSPGIVPTWGASAYNPSTAYAYNNSTDLFSSQDSRIITATAGTSIVEEGATASFSPVQGVRSLKVTVGAIVTGLVETVVAGVHTFLHNSGQTIANTTAVIVHNVKDYLNVTRTWMSVDQNGSVRFPSAISNAGQLYIGDMPMRGTATALGISTDTNPAGLLVVLYGAAGFERGFDIRAGFLSRWQVVASSTPESGGNAGSNLIIRALDDAGTPIDLVISIARVANGNITLGRKLACRVSATAAAPINLNASGSAPTSKVDGDIFRTGTDVLVFYNGSADRTFAFLQAVNAFTGNNSFSGTSTFSNARGIQLTGTGNVSQNGDFAQDTTQKAFQGQTAGIRQYMSTVLISQYSTKTIANTTVATSIFGSFVGTGRTLPANFFTQAKSLRIKFYGRIANTGSPTINFVFSLGGITIVTTGAVTTGPFSGTEAINGEAVLVCRAVGASGGVWGCGFINIHNGAGTGSITQLELVPISSAVVINTTIAQDLDVTAQWSVDLAANTLSIDILTVEVLA